LEEMCREYLARRQMGAHEQADFVVLEMIDQCVRQVGGGEMGGGAYRRYRADPVRHADMINYVRLRIGEDLRPASGLASGGSRVYPARRRGPTGFFGRLTRLPKALARRVTRARQRLGLALLPTAFREQNVSLAGIGERHHWLWDEHQLTEALRAAGFTAIERCRWDSSR